MKKILVLVLLVLLVLFGVYVYKDNSQSGQDFIPETMDLEVGEEEYLDSNIPEEFK